MAVDFRAERDLALLTLEHERDFAARAGAADRLCELALAAPPEVAREFSEVVARLLADAQTEVRCAGLALAAEVLPDDEAAGLLTRYAGEREQRVRLEAVGRIADLERPELRGALAAALEDDSLRVRFEAARGMAGLGHPAGFEVLVEALTDADLRFRAAGALARLGDPRATPHLKQLMGRWFLPAFDRTQVAGALAALGDADGVAHLVKRSHSRLGLDRAMAIELLGVVRAPGAKALLLEVLNDAKDVARGAAARALGHLGDASVEPRLIETLADATVTDDVRLDFAEALLRLGGVEGRARVEALTLSSSGARAELSALLKELGTP